MVKEQTNNINDLCFHFQPGQYVSYSGFGVCKIVALENRTFDGIHEETYYKLCPLDNSHSTYYIPFSRANERIRPLLTKEQIYTLIDEMALEKDDNSQWCDNSRQRRGIFQSILHNDDYREMIQMMRSLHQQAEKKRSSGRRLSAADEAAMHSAESRLYQEFGIVLHIQPDQVHNFIKDRIAGSNK